MFKVAWIWSSSVTSSSMQSHSFLNGMFREGLLLPTTSTCFPITFVEKWFHYFLGYFSYRFFFWRQNRQTYVSSVYLLAYQRVIYCAFCFVWLLLNTYFEVAFAAVWHPMLEWSIPKLTDSTTYIYILKGWS